MPCERVSLPIRALLVNLEGIRFPGLFESKVKYTWVPVLDPEDIMVLSLGGPSGTLIKGQGPPELMSVYGAQRALP